MAEAKIREGLDFMEAGRKAYVFARRGVLACCLAKQEIVTRHDLTRYVSRETKTSLFGKKKPDWDSATYNYDEAAKCFKGAQAYDHAVEAFIKAANGHKEMGSLFMAAKALESGAAIAAQQLKRLDQAADLYRQTSDFFIAQGSPDRAGDALEKAAKAMQPSNIEQCIALYVEACNVYEQEDRMRFGTDTFKRAISIALQNRRYDIAIDLSVRLADGYVKLDQKPNFNKQALTTVIIALVAGDEVDAGKRFEQYAGILGFGHSEEGKIAQDLLGAYESGDEPLLASTLKRPQINFLDNEVTRAVRALRVPVGRAPGQKAGVPGPSIAAMPEEEIKALQDEVEEEGFL
ncbi:hypothetical protein HK104_003480 [Borealophlyctis nickersoniae]|nr:hypothetical protein HK104_003480 [Borealophlyctis nickersoniae]